MGTARRVFGIVLILSGVAVFAVRLHHAGPYAFPGGGNLRAGVLALLLGAWLARDWMQGALATRINGIAASIGVVVLFFALYATLAEIEETVTLRATDLFGEPADLRLWIIDVEGAQWVNMKRSKAEDHRLDGARLQLLRAGAFHCVVPTLDDRRERAKQIHALRQEKYAVQRLATAIGVMPATPPDDTVSLRLEPCPPA
jgi:hypothetical protein